MGRPKGARDLGQRKVRRTVVVQPNDESIRLIPLTKEMVAIVDAFLYEWLIEFNWHAAWNPATESFYAVCRVPGNRRRIRMQHLIVGLKDDDPRIVDHQNMNSLDNRGSNLRPATHAQNHWNRGLISTNTTGFIGVSPCTDGNKFRAYITCHGKLLHLGRYHTAEAAARARDAKAKELYGGFAVLNFPERNENDKNRTTGMPGLCGGCSGNQEVDGISTAHTMP